MLNKSFLMIIFLLGFTTNSVYAHSVLLDTHPKEGEVVTESLSTVTLNFNTKIEKGSSFYIENKKGEKISPSKISLKDRSVKGQFNSSISNGNYSLFWAVIGSDGHQIKGEYAFKVKLVKEEELNESKQENIVQDSTKAGNKETTGKQGEDKQNSNYWQVTILLVLLLVILAWGIALVRRRLKER